MKSECTVISRKKTELTADITVPDVDSDDYYAKILLWDDLVGMNPMHNGWIINN